MQVVENFTAGSLGSIVALHGQHYATNWGFGTFFEAKVALELAEFSNRKASYENNTATFNFSLKELD
jgi:hypothetical protein